jgi:hypothetical protein
MKRAIIIPALLFFGAVFTSCRNATEELPTAAGTDTPTRPVDNTATFTHTPSTTQTRQPTIIKPTYTVTNTPITYSSFDGSLPHLAYWAQNAGGETEIVLFNPETMGRKTLDLPEGVENMQIAGALSPDGEWLAFHTGSAGNTAPFDLTLHLLHLTDRKMITVAELLSPDYPANFDEVAEYLMANDPHYSEVEDIEEVKKLIMEIFLYGINTFDWSPDSRYLAFAGEMDGPTSDLYVYDTQTGGIRRLTDGYGQMVGGMSWSPDGKWILHSSTNNPNQIQWTREVFAARADGGGAKLVTGSMSLGKWISPNTAIFSEAANGPGPYELRKVNVETGKVSYIWEDSYVAYALSAVDGSAAVCANDGFFDESIEAGLYIVRPIGEPQHLSSEYHCVDLAYRGEYTHEFLMNGGDDGIYGVTPEYAVEAIVDKEGWMFVSPDYQWMVFHERSEAGGISALRLFDRDDVPLRDIDAYLPEHLLWRGDSLGLFFALENRMYYLSIPDGTPILVEENLENCYGDVYCFWGAFDYRWIP